MKEYTSATNMTRKEVIKLLPDMWQETCDRGGCLTFRLISGSMEPLIRVGDRVKVSRMEPSRLRIGDIIAFREGRGVTVHRIIRRSHIDGQLYFYAQGDAGSGWGKVTKEDLIGKVYAIERDQCEILLDTPRYMVVNKILGWRLFLVACLRIMKYRSLSNGIRLALRPAWRLSRRILLLNFLHEERQ